MGKESIYMTEILKIGTPKSLPISKCPAAPIQSKTVLPAEVCTLEVAKQLGINDSKNYFTKDYDSIRTMNPTIDDSTDKKYDTLCYQSTVNKDAYPNCVLEHGIGFTRKPGFPDKCITVGCPPGFKSSPNGDGCIKNTIDATITTNSKCSERWYDWFTLPNYHLGNKYTKEKDCFAPCRDNYVPAYATDPVDGGTIDFTSKDDMGKCVHKYNYFGGKYRDTPDFCPIAIIKRLGSTKQDLINEYNTILDKKRSQGNENMNAVEKDIKGIIETILKDGSKGITDIVAPDGDYLKACRTLHTEDRLAESYSKCKILLDNPDSIIEQYVREGLRPEEAKLRLLMLKKACHSVFCNANDDAGAIVAEKVWPPNSCKKDDLECPNRITGEPLCFKEVESINLDAEAAKLKKEENKDIPEISSEKALYKLNDSFKYMLFFMIVPILLLTLYGIYSELILPKILKPIWYNIILPILRRIKYWFTGFKGSTREDVLAQQISGIEAMSLPTFKKPELGSPSDLGQAPGIENITNLQNITETASALKDKFMTSPTASALKNKMGSLRGSVRSLGAFKRRR